MNVFSTYPMNRLQLKTSDEELVAEFGRVMDLFSCGFKARSNGAAFFTRVNEAAAQGFSWVDALEKAVKETDKTP